MPNRLASIVFVALACAVSVFAQEERRERVIGQVLDKNGEAWANAEVTLYSRAIPGYERGTRTDEVTVESNARGRFRAELLPGRPYSAWAVAAVGETGYRTTLVLENVLPGRPIRLHEDGELHHRVTLTVRGAEAWKAKAPLSLTVHTCTPVNILVAPLELDAKHRVVLPALPGDRAWIEVHGKADYPIYSDFVPLTERERKRYLLAQRALVDSWKLRQEMVAKNKRNVPDPFPPTDSVDEAILSIPPPRTITVQVNDASGKPIANPVALRDLEHARAPWYPLATGDNNGRVRFEVPAIELADTSFQVRPFDLLVRHPDHADNCFPTKQFRLPRDRGDQPDMTVKLSAGRTVKGRVLFGEKQPAAHLPLVVYSSITRGSGGGQIACGPHTFETDAQGRFELPGRADGRVYRLCAVPRKDQIQHLPARLAGLPVLWLRSAKPKPTQDLGDIRIDELRTVVIEVQRPDGAAAPRETVFATESFDTGDVPYYPMRYLTDRRGKVRLTLPDAKSLCLVVASANGAASIELGSEGVPDGVVAMPLSRERKLEGRVTDTEGNSIPNCRVLTTQLRGADHGTNNWVTIGMLARHNEPRPGEFYWTNFWKYRRWSRYSHPVSEIPVDANGKFMVFVPHEIHQATLMGRVFRDGRSIDSPAVTVSTADAAPRTISIPLPANNGK